MSFKLPIEAKGIPAMGFGTGTRYYKRGEKVEFNDSLVKMLVYAVENGFTHLDTAESYRVYPEFDAALKQLKEKGFKQSQLFITDKYDTSARPGEPISKDGDPYKHLKKTLEERIHLKYVDLYLLHSPFITKDKFGFTLEEAWQSMEKCKDAGLAKRIGVSNFGIKDLKRILKIAKFKPAVNQIEFSCFLQNQTPDIVNFCKENNITVEAFSPLSPITKADHTKGVGKELDAELESLASKYHKTKSQLLLRWVYQRGLIFLSTTSKESRIQEWKGIFDFELTPTDEEKITEIGNKCKPQFRLYWHEYDQYN